MLTFDNISVRNVSVLQHSRAGRAIFAVFDVIAHFVDLCFTSDYVQSETLPAFGSM